jgi:dTDP-4-dehydrorhamnose reductase
LEKAGQQRNFVVYYSLDLMPSILVTGANGQLGRELRDLASNLPSFRFVFTGVAELDLTDEMAVQQAFAAQPFAFCLNAAAYTAVDKAEHDAERARLVNVTAVEHLARACQAHDTGLIHLSTDFVFAGQKSVPYTETDPTEPLGVYGRTKLAGEQAALAHNPRTLVVRTAWLYSEYGNNFVKTMLRLGRERGHLRVVADQVGSPTYARDLAAALLQVVSQLASDWPADSSVNGIYHYSNEGVASWYDFAHAIFDLADLPVALEPIATSGYPTPAQRPAFSVMDKTKLKSTFGLTIPHWRDSLRACLARLERGQIN